MRVHPPTSSDVCRVILFLSSPLWTEQREKALSTHLGTPEYGWVEGKQDHLRLLSLPSQLTVDKIVSKGRVLTMANQILMVNISEEVRACSERCQGVRPALGSTEFHSTEGGGQSSLGHLACVSVLER